MGSLDEVIGKTFTIEGQRADCDAARPTCADKKCFACAIRGKKKAIRPLSEDLGQYG
jgi:hypothetical protein